MAHEVETMMYTGEVPWHGLGTYVGEKPLKSSDAIIKAELDWKVEEKDLIAGKIGDSDLYHVNSHKAITRADNGSILGIVGNTYKPIQNTDAFEFMDSLVEEGVMRYHTAGSLRDGKRIWLLGKVDSYDVVPGDQIDEYIFLWNSHDGTTALKCMPTTVRVVCANTARAALDEGSAKGISIRHTKNVNANLKEAQEILTTNTDILKKFREFATHTTKIQMNEDKLNKFLLTVVPDPKEGKTNTKAKNTREKMKELFETGRGNDLPGVKGTGWAAFNSVTEFANYHRSSNGNRQDRRFESTLFGSSASLIKKASKAILYLAA